MRKNSSTLKAVASYPPSTINRYQPLSTARRRATQQTQFSYRSSLAASKRSEDGLIPAPIKIQNSKIKNPWNLYFRVTMPDAVDLGLLTVINRTRDSDLTPEQFISDCQSRSGSEEVYQQSYMCNPLGASSNHIVEWSAIERCRYDYSIIRIHLEHQEIIAHFGEFVSGREQRREEDTTEFIHKRFLPLFQSKGVHRLGFDVAASGQGDLAVIYIDERKQDDLWLRGLFTCRTEDWHFLKTVLFKFLRDLRSVQAVGDETGLGRQICWEACHYFGGVFNPVNFSSKKRELGFSLMNQLSVAQKRFPKSEQDIASDYFALQKSFKAHAGSSAKAATPSHCELGWRSGFPRPPRK